MGILIIHNEYSVRGGEESVVAFQERLFLEKGNDVDLYVRRNERPRNIFIKIGRFAVGFMNPRARRQVARRAWKKRPRTAVIHNLYHRITPSVLKPLKKRGTGTVMVLHNFRLLCPTALFFRDGEICRECVTHSSREWRCAVNNCAGRRAESLFLAMRGRFVRSSGVVMKNIDHFVTLTGFQRDIMAENGIPAEKLVTIPNAIETGTTLPETVKENFIGFVGRMTPEKGVDVFVGLAGKMPEQKFKIAGAAALPEGIEKPENVEMMGILAKEELQAFYRSATAIMMSSRCYETFPMVILEAFANGTPVIVPNHGAMPAIVDDGENGIVYGIAELDALAARVRAIKAEKWREMGENGFKKARREYNPGLYYQKFEELFR